MIIAWFIRYFLHMILQKKLDEMPAEKLREVLKGVLQKTPGILFDVMEPEGGRHNPPPNADLDWCTCSNCTQMPSVAERVCCGHVPESCVTTWPVSVGIYTCEALSFIIKLEFLHYNCLS
jgi:hypothetical protein